MPGSTIMSEAPYAGGTLRAAFRSDPGRVRTNNEDVPIVDAERGVYGVIDGVGGHAAGEVAAAVACDVILQRLARPIGTPAERVREAIAIANNEIFRRASDSPELHGMACVVTLAILSDGVLTVGHVGDSRLYKVSAAGVTKLTHDHSPIGEREDAREISEADAMRHPRRHEVYRDVGSACRDKDEADFVEVITEPIEHDTAILLCTDGLTDMIPAAMIEYIIGRHAGDPEAVADALVASANEAGGRDNVTVVYAEGPDFATAIRGGASNASAENAPGARGALPTGPGRIGRAARRIVASRTTWFAVGALTAVLGGLAVLWYAGEPVVAEPRTLVVGAEVNGGLARIEDAMARARPGDVVRLEPGVYPEAVVLTEGVSLVARVPGSATIVRPAGVSGGWTALTALGTAAGRISGIRIESTRDLPIEFGVRLSGPGWTVELVELAGPMRAAIDVLPASVVSIQGCQIAVQGVALALADGAHAVVASTVFIRSGPPGPAISLGAPSQATLKRNLFAGYGSDVVKGITPAERQQILAGNYVVAAEPSLLR